MTTSCLICLRPSADLDHHVGCLEELFGVGKCPTVDLGDSGLGTAIAHQSGRISISGVQQKLLVALSEDRTRLQPNDHGRYILKPQTPGYKHLPENELLTMRLALLVGLRVPCHGLVRVGNDNLAYVVKRFDRTDDSPPRKLLQEDFCSLSGRDPSDKYEATAEECADLSRRHSGRPEESLRQLFLLFAYSYWISNEDLHLKNLSLLQGPDGLMTLSPVYDLLSTRLYPRLRHFEALSLNGKRDQLVRSDFEAFGTHCALPAAAVRGMLDRLLALGPEAERLVRASPLSTEAKREYLKWMKRKGKLLATRRAKR